MVGIFNHYPLYIYLTEYRKALTAYESSIHDLASLQKSYEETKESVWKITENRASESSRCADNRRVTGEHFYRQCHMDEVAVQDVRKKLEQIRQLLHKTSFQYKCTAELARFQVESYLYGIVKKNPATSNISDYSSIIPRAECIPLSETNELRICIGIIISFLRIPVSNDIFLHDLGTWLKACSGILLRVATFFDQLFLLNHILRSPSSVIQWTASLLQISLPGEFSGGSCNNPFVKHFVALLRCVLIPTKGRNEFLSAFTLDHLDDDVDSTWIVVDPDAEGTEMMRSTAVVDMQENDIFLLLTQFPFNKLFSLVLGSDCLELDLFARITEHEVLALLAFSHGFLDVLMQGVLCAIFSQQRYETFVQDRFSICGGDFHL